MNDEVIKKVKFDAQGLVPAIVQDAETGAVLMLAYMNRESLQRTIETGETHFWSRSRKELWRKGETSGNTQTVRSMKLDCDADTVLISVDQKGNACHTGTYSCFTHELHETSTQSDSLPSAIGSLAKVIAERKRELPEKSYTTQLFRGGIDKILKKVGEESAEVIIAAKNNNKEEIAWEVADLLYHVMVMCAAEDVPLGSVASQLVQRQGKVSKSIQPG